jgi:hypothetical protein
MASAMPSEPIQIGSNRNVITVFVGAIVGAISGGEVRGRAVRIPRNSVITFRLERSLDMGVADHGVTRDGTIITIGTTETSAKRPTCGESLVVLRMQ